MFNGRLGIFRWWRSLRSPTTDCGDVPPRRMGINDDVNI